MEVYGKALGSMQICVCYCDLTCSVRLNKPSNKQHRYISHVAERLYLYSKSLRVSAVITGHYQACTSHKA